MEQSTAFALVFVIIISYLLGSISFSYIIAKKIKKVDIRQHGSGNAGATNTLRLLGKGPALIVLALDILKGVVAVGIGMAFSDPSGLLPALAGFAAICGHNWPIFHNFRGGKGVATTIGVLMSIVFYPALLAGIIAIASIILFRFVSLGSLLFTLCTAIFTAIFMVVFDYSYFYVYLTVALALLSFWRHHENIKRLFLGTESKIGQKS